MIEFQKNYFVSKCGNIWSNKSGEIKKLKAGKNIHGYLSIVLRDNGKSKTTSVHRIVAKNFIDNFKDFLDVNHIDGDKTNNRLENLEMVTRSENIKHAVKIGLIRKRGYLDSSNYRSKMDECHMLAIITTPNLSNRSLARSFNTHHYSIKRLKDQAREFGL